MGYHLAGEDEVTHSWDCHSRNGALDAIFEYWQMARIDFLPLTRTFGSHRNKVSYFR